MALQEKYSHRPITTLSFAEFRTGVATHHFRRYCRFTVVCQGRAEGQVAGRSREGACRPWWSLGKACGQSLQEIFGEKYTSRRSPWVLQVQAQISQLLAARRLQGSQLR
jgi:hypothetical protein